MSDLLITVAVNNRYTSYIDMWELALSKAYPEYDTAAVVFNPGNTPQYYGACIRFLKNMSECNGKQYKYTYITDVDMMIVREDVPLLDFHLNEIKETGLCYSNTARGTETEGPNRLTGLHFVTGEWWGKTKVVRDRYFKKLCAGEIGNSPIDDELMLMKIVKESWIETPPPRRDLIGRHHGLHLGTVRAHKSESHQSLRRAVHLRVSPDKAKKWQGVVCSREYSSILSKVQKSDRMAYEEFMIMDRMTKQIEKM